MKTVALGMAMLLGGCTSAYLVKTQYVIIEPPQDLYQCVLAKFPDHKTLTDRQVAKLIVELHRNNVTCKTSLELVRRYIDEAKETIK